MAEVLLGETNPSGKLPYRYPQYEMDQMAYYEASSSLVAPLYPFGHGLSFTSFCYLSLSLSSPSLPIAFDLSLTVSVSLSNCGSRDGAEAVLLVRPLPPSSSLPQTEPDRVFDDDLLFLCLMMMKSL